MIEIYYCIQAATQRIPDYLIWFMDHEKSFMTSLRPPWSEDELSSQKGRLNYNKLTQTPENYINRYISIIKWYE